MEIEDTRSTRWRMIGKNDLMDFILASLGTALDEIYQRLIECNFGTEDPVDRLTLLRRPWVPTHRSGVDASFRRVRYRREKQK